MATFKEKDWKENFRLSKNTFQYLCNQVCSYIQRKNTRLRLCITVEYHVGITLWCLATCGKYRTIGHLFGVARITVCLLYMRRAKQM